MHLYQIESSVSGTVLGQYRGENEAEALDRMARDAGYRDYAHACEVVPVKPGDIYVWEVE